MRAFLVDDEALALKRLARMLTATGRVTYFSGKTDMIADQAVIYRKEKRAVFTGHVDMLVKAKKDQDQPPKKEDIPSVNRDAPTVKADTAARRVAGNIGFYPAQQPSCFSRGGLPCYRDSVARIVSHGVV